MDVVLVDAHQSGQRQRRSELGKLCRLQSQRADDEPGVGTLDAMGVEDGGKEQDEEQSINNVREHIIKAVVEQKTMLVAIHTICMPERVESDSRSGSP